jgi:hypothetical protein
MTVDVAQLAEAWIRYWRQPKHDENDSDRNASEQLDELVREDPLNALRIMDKIVERTSEKKVLCQLGAGPLEDLLGSAEGARYVDEVLDRARQDKNWRFALGCVWTSGFSDKKVAEHIEQAIAQYFPEDRP